MGLRIDRTSGRTQGAPALANAGGALAAFAPALPTRTSVPRLESAMQTLDALSEVFRKSDTLVAQLRARFAGPGPVAPSPDEQGLLFGLLAGVKGTAAVLLDETSADAKAFNAGAERGFAIGAKVRRDRAIGDAAQAHVGDPEGFESATRQALEREVEQLDPRLGVVLEALYENRIGRERAKLEAARQAQERALEIATLDQSFRDDFAAAQEAAREGDFDEMEARSTQAVAAIRRLQDRGVVPADEADRRVESLRVITRNETVSGLFREALADGEAAAQAFIADFATSPQEGFTEEEQREFATLLGQQLADHQRQAVIAATEERGREIARQGAVGADLYRRARQGDPSVRTQAADLMRTGALDPTFGEEVIQELDVSLRRRQAASEDLLQAKERYYGTEAPLIAQDPRDQFIADTIFEHDIQPGVRRLREDGRVEEAVDVVVEEIARKGIVFSEIADAIFTRLDRLTHVDDLEYAVRLILALQERHSTARPLNGMPAENDVFVERVRSLQRAGIRDLREAIEQAHVVLGPIQSEKREITQQQYAARRADIEPGNADFLWRSLWWAFIGPDRMDAMRSLLGSSEEVKKTNAELDVAQREILPRFHQLAEHYYIVNGGDELGARTAAWRRLVREFRPSAVGIGPHADVNGDGMAIRRRPLEGELPFAGLIEDELQEFLRRHLRTKVEGYFYDVDRVGAATRVKDDLIEVRYIPKSESEPGHSGLPAYQVFYHSEGEPELLDFEWHVTLDDVRREVERQAQQFRREVQERARSRADGN